MKNSDDLKNIISYYGKHYYYATLFFPKKIKEKVIITYAFVRRLDNIVDDPFLSFKEKSERFKEWELEFNKVILNQNSKFKELKLFYQIIKEKNIPIEYVKAFINSMKFDLNPVRIKTFKELEKYMYGSATVVGYFLLYIFDCYQEYLKEYAKSLAEAMQLTNFLRDIKEDLSLNRIYIPEEIYQKYDLKESDFLKLKFNDKFKNMMQELILINLKLYKKARLGIKKLPFKVKFPVFYASNLYQSILNEIKNNNYDVFNFNYKLKLKTKILIFIKSFFYFLINKYE
ncbi:MAG: phytoene/squalene synthase family protein [Minisyncoccia bacterium]